MSVLRCGRSGGRSKGRSAKFVLILTTRYQYWKVDVINLNSSWPLDVRTGGRSAKFEFILTTRSQYWGGRSAKYELILTTRCHYWGVVDLVAVQGIDLPNLNSIWQLDVSTEGGRSDGQSRGWTAKFESILTIRCQYWRIDLSNLNSSWPLDVSTEG